MNAVSALPTNADINFLGLNVGNSSQARLEDVARQMEGVFVSMMLKSMRETMAGDMFAGDGADVWGGIFDQSMGEQIASAGGLGLIDQLQPRSLSVKA